MRNADMPAMPLAEPEIWADSTKPSLGTVSAYGISKREYFAGLAMQGLLSSFGQHDVTDFGEIASDAALAADALLTELERTS